MLASKNVKAINSRMNAKFSLLFMASRKLAKVRYFSKVFSGSIVICLRKYAKKEKYAIIMAIMTTEM